MNFIRTIILAVAIFAVGAFVVASPRPPSGEAASSHQAATTEPVDINHASLAELKTLPGIGDAYSLAIVKHRPYKNKTQLRSKGAIPLAAYNKIKDKIIAKQ